MNPTLDNVWNDYRLLDSEDFTVPKNVRLISHENIAVVSGIHVDRINPNSFVKLFKWFSPLFSFFYVLQLLLAADRNTVVIVNGGSTLWLYFGYINRFFFRSRKTLLLWDVFVEYHLGVEKRLRFFPLIKVKTSWKECIAKNSLRGFDIAVHWSKKQVGTHAKWFGLPERLFIFLPFKANHSKNPEYDIPMDDFLFAGGNGKRDYATLVEAVRGTNIPVIISATDPRVRKTIGVLPNVIVLGAPEPAFAQLQAASRLIVIPMIDSGLKGGGEANFCNAMWHRKPVIAVDNMAAEDYIVEGETGYIVPCGDSQLLKQRILELWNDPKKCREMGEKGHEHVLKNFTHEKFIRRLVRLALILGDEKVNSKVANENNDA